MTSDAIGFAAFLLIAVSAVVLSATSAASLFLSWNQQIQVPGEPNRFLPIQSDLRTRATLCWLHAICIVTLMSATLLVCVSLLSAGVLPAWRLIYCLAGVVVVGSVTFWIRHRGSKGTM